jgi:serine/threonine protein phosphatase PrpC
LNTLFNRLRKKKTTPKSAQENVDTIPLSDKQISNIVETRSHIEPSQLVFGSAQSVGKQRDQNEDCLFALSITIGGKANNYPLGLFIVADGMGGHQYGEIASSVAVRTMAGYLIKRFNTYLTSSSENFDEPMQDLMRSAINEAQRTVTKVAPGSGTTVTAAMVVGQQMTIAHVGDSRAYFIHPDGKTEMLTRDHSLVKRLEELGQISSDEATAHPQRNVLYRALGQGENLEPDIFTTPFPQPGCLMLCSDGLWSVITDDTISKIVNKAPNLHSACNDLVTAANDAGGPDNISAVLVQLVS